MASMISKISRIARSPQGKQAIARAQEIAKDPETKRKLEDARRKLASKRGGGPKH